MLRVVVLISGAGSNLRALLEAIDASASGPDPIRAEVVAIGADTTAEGLGLAAEHGADSFIVDPRAYPDRASWGDALLEEIQRYSPDLVVLSGFMRLLPPRVVRALSPALVNTHPAYLPEFPGAHAVRDALKAGVTETGASIIVVDDGVDTGPIIARERVAIEPGDDEARLHERIKQVERRLLIETVRDVANGSLDLGAVPPSPARTESMHPDTEPKERP